MVLFRLVEGFRFVLCDGANRGRMFFGSVVLVVGVGFIGVVSRGGLGLLFDCYFICVLVGLRCFRRFFIVFGRSFWIFSVGGVVVSRGLCGYIGDVGGGFVVVLRCR